MSNAVAKCWTVRALSVANDPLSITCGDYPFAQGAVGQLGSSSPVEYLLISIAACFALSCRMALAQPLQAAACFEVLVRGTKALDAPSRVTSIEIELAIDSRLVGDAEHIAEKAKQLCTVTDMLAQGLRPMRMRARPI